MFIFGSLVVWFYCLCCLFIYALLVSYCMFYYLLIWFNGCLVFCVVSLVWDDLLITVVCFCLVGFVCLRFAGFTLLFMIWY